MPEKSRRDVCLSLPFLALFGQTLGNTQSTGSTTSSLSLSHSKAFAFDQLPVKTSAVGSSRSVLRGTLPTGEEIEMHETTLSPGKMPHPPHKHVHSEFMMIREGTVEFAIEGKPQQLGPGGVAYAASNELHSLKNVGDTPANYFVIAIGKEQAAK